MDWKLIETVPRDGKQSFLALFPGGYVAHVYLTTPESPMAQTFRFFGGPVHGQPAGWPSHWMPVDDQQPRPVLGRETGIGNQRGIMP